MADTDVTQIKYFRQGRLPELRFEWHPSCGIMYVIQTKAGVQEADPFAWSVKDHGAAWNAVLIWCRGYFGHKYDFPNATPEQRQENMNHEQ